MGYYVYRFLDEESNILYVGRTKDIKQRMDSHFISNGHLPISCYAETKKIEYIRYLSEFDMIFSEIYYINKFRPPYNVKDVYKKEPSYFLELYEPPFKWAEYQGFEKPTDTPSIRFRFKEIMEERNITPSRLVEITGLKPNAVTRLLNDRGNGITREHVGKICNALNITDLNEIMVIK